MTKLLSYTEIEKIYGLRKNTTTKMLSRGEFINPVKIGNKNYFKTEDIEAWIDSKMISTCIKDK